MSTTTEKEPNYTAEQVQQIRDVLRAMTEARFNEALKTQSTVTEKEPNYTAEQVQQIRDVLRAMTEARFNEALKTQELETMPV
jgi:uncharacterized protein YciW